MILNYVISIIVYLFLILGYRLTVKKVSSVYCLNDMILFYRFIIENLQPYPNGVHYLHMYPQMFTKCTRDQVVIIWNILSGQP